MISRSGGQLLGLNIMQSNSAVEVSAESESMGIYWTRVCVEIGGATQAWFARIDEQNHMHWLAGWPETTFSNLFDHEKLEKNIISGQDATFILPDGAGSGGIFPVLRNNRVLGLLCLISTKIDFFLPASTTWIKAFAEIIADNLLQAEKLSNWKQVKSSITWILQSTSDLRSALPTVLEMLSDIVGSDAAIVIKHKPASRQYDLLSTHGFDAKDLAKIHLYVSLGLAKNFSEDQARVQIGNLSEPEPQFHKPGHFLRDSFQAHIALPLTSSRDLLGVLEIFWKQPCKVEKELEIIKETGDAITCALARNVDVDNLKHINKELTSTYTSTIEGLSRALELRDLETEGHTRRVSTLMIKLAEHMQIPADQHTVIQQGALLHDIGKLGIPDAILLKPGSLTSQEWKVMQQHPLYAYNILAPIVSLRQTLDIPLYHHERWNGSGYPYGMKGEQIPLSARMFAVVDVFDALTSDRPYRSAWPRSHALKYIRQQSGIQFDPQVVGKFMELLEEQELDVNS